MRARKGDAAIHQREIPCSEERQTQHRAVLLCTRIVSNIIYVLNISEAHSLLKVACGTC